MMLLYARKDAQSLELKASILSFLRKNKMGHEEISGLSELKRKKQDENAMLLVIGDDNTLLEAFRNLDDNSLPVLGFASGKSFLMQIDPSNLESALILLKKRKFSVLRRARIEAHFNSNERPVALNDIGIFPSKSASLMRFSIHINNEQLWNDSADGIIASTPTGSTGYSYSAHGPIILGEPGIISISSISSMQKKPSAIVSNNSTITIESIDAQNPVVIMDGDIRVPLKSDRVIIQKSRHDALFVQFSKEYAIERKFKQRSIQSRQLSSRSLSPSTKLILKTLSYEGALTQKELITGTLLPERTVRYAIAVLLRKKLIQAKAHLIDARQTMYEVLA